ncbi:MAG: hypothetical protein LC115_00665 [Bacteroidia bacterium]|nr:hypothetical protein [Bacteroidia bacterium]
MKNIKNLFVIGLGLVVISVSCKKKEDTPAPSASKTELLCNKTYTMKALTANPGVNMGTGTPVTDLFSYIPACSKDDKITFKTTGKVTTDEGASKCTATDPQSYDEDWKFTTNESIIELTDKDGKKKNYTVITIDGTTFKTSYVEDDSSTTPPTKRTYTVTMQK